MISSVFQRFEGLARRCSLGAICYEHNTGVAAGPGVQDFHDFLSRRDRAAHLPSSERDLEGELKPEAEGDLV